MADDKKDANSQRGVDAPKPRTREEGASLSDVVDKLKDGNQEQNRTTEATTGLVANMMKNDVAIYSDILFITQGTLYSIIMILQMLS